MTREEAIKQIRLVLENLKSNLEKDTREAFETLIPEIKESEYERIRKKILDIVRAAPFDEEKDILEDWLEKQEEQKIVEWSEDIIQKAVKEVGLTQHQIDWFKTNVFPPKQEWSEEDERKIGRLRSIVNKCAFYNGALDVNGDYCEGDYGELDEWLKSLRQQS